MHDHSPVQVARITDKVNWAITKCRAQGLRRTEAMQTLLTVLASSDRPMTLAELAESENLAGECDKATVYRLLVRLEGQGIIRRLGLHERSAYFSFLYPGEHHDYLICTECGDIREIGLSCPLAALEKEVSEKFGYQSLYHELEFFGRCPQCV